MPLRLSVLDQSVACAGRGEDHALRDTLELAQHCEALGYERFWVSEHHGMPTIVGTAPEVLMAAIAARTTRIRIGSAGVMLPHYSAFKVAENFRVLDALAPGRIDLGLGRAPGSDRRTAQALNPHVSGMAEDFPQQVLDLQAWVSGPPPASADRRPEMWILGSSDYGAQLAAHLGLPYAFAYFFMDGQGVEQALDLYRSLYRPSERHPKPEVTICVWALAADRDEEAEFQALSRERWRVNRQRGLLGPLQRPQDVAAQGFSDEEMAVIVAPLRRKALVGSAATVQHKMEDLARSLELDHLVVNTWAHDPAVRRHSYALLAREFGLDGSTAPATGSGSEAHAVPAAAAATTT
ncbi:MAG: LLM class flavin-dependent oxidoreductase [Rubrivivax sp.]|nr:LLM class flavin-dependent oxidoreductase [Rubrivivax sp.]